ncbi:restriction endonuclease subunit M [Bacteroidia bacterium]|nr:restriction endonuclease subunit M [Bacteroidia bacterium]
MKTPITYYGGKQNMLKHIRPLIPVHNLYCEPFAGGAAVFFDKKTAKVNVINDLNGELINFYRTIVSDLPELQDEIAQTLHCRNQYEHAWHIYNHPDFFSNVQRAWAVFILTKLGFGGLISSSFGFDKSEGKHPIKMQCAKETALCKEIKTLLEQTTIECDDAFAIIRRYDCPDAWFFIDPPYVGSNMGHYSGMFNEQNLIELLDMCTGLQGKFMFTMYPNDTIKEYAEKHNWTIHRVNRLVSACKAEARRMQEEWMICNYKQVSNNTLFDEY